MNPVVVRNVRIGEGIPKICVPVAERTEAGILKAAKEICGVPADIVEWRADWFESVSDPGKVTDILRKLREILDERPILFTLRTAAEGGEAEVRTDEYIRLNKTAAASGEADLLDVELFAGDEAVRELVADAHAQGVRVVASNHDFKGTPEKEEILRRLCKMQELDADILKIAVMPEAPRDVLTLLAATEEMTSSHADRPVVTMSMSGTGVISRICGEVFGSALTFGFAGRASAPGQVGAGDLNRILQLLHRSVRI